MAMADCELNLELQGQRILLNEWIVNALENRPAPREAMDPAQFLSELAHISILERVGKGLQFRLTGTEIRARLRQDVKGLDPWSLRRLSGVSEILRPAHKALELQEPVAGVSAVGPSERHFWLRLPLICRSGRVSQVLCHDRIIDVDAVIDDSLREEALCS